MHHAPPAGRLPWSAHILTTRVAIGSSTVQRHFRLQGNVYNDPVSAKLLFPQHTSFAVRAIPRPWIPGLVSQCRTRLAAVPFFSDAVEKKRGANIGSSSGKTFAKLHAMHRMGNASE